jgi:hypothetical protein
MKNIEILQKVADLVGFTFSSTHNFAEVELEGGITISNQTEGDFMIGDVIAVKNEDGTFTIVGAGEHKLAGDGGVFITDEEGKLVEIRQEESEEPVIEVEVETGDEKEMMESTKIQELKTAIHDVLFAFEKQSQEITELKKDYEAFKKSSAYTPLKEDKLITNAFSTDHRYEVLKEWKERMRK